MNVRPSSDDRGGAAQPLLIVRDLKKHFPAKGSFWSLSRDTVQAVDGVSFSVAKGQTVGVVGEVGWYQGNVVLSGVTQRRGRGIDAGVSYAVAPGFTVFGEYIWNDMTQSRFNFVTAAAGSNANNNVKGQGVMIGNMISF